jgi:hypothetical protein
MMGALGPPSLRAAASQQPHSTSNWRSCDLVGPLISAPIALLIPTVFRSPVSKPSANRLTVRQRIRWRIQRGEEIGSIAASQD